MPFNDCVEEQSEVSSGSFVSFTHELTLKTFGYYNQEFCRQLFYQRLLVSKCNCYDNRFVLMFDTNEFNNNNNNANKIYSCNQLLLPNACYKKLRSDFLTNKLDCRSECPTGCQSINYKPLLHYSEYPSDFYKQILVRNEHLVGKLFASDRDNKKEELNDINEIDFRSSLLMVDVYFESDSYTKITEVPETNFSQLLANLGGQFGLFLGLISFNFSFYFFVY